MNKENYEGLSDDELISRAESLIEGGDTEGAQKALDEVRERGGKWCYLQSVVFYRKKWINESRKQLEIAIRLEPENEEYKKALKELEDFRNSDEFKKIKREKRKEQMGGMSEACLIGCCECCGTGACDAICNGCS